MTVTQTKFPFRLIDYKMGKQDDAPVLRLIWEITDELEMIHQYGIDPPREIGTNCQFELHRSRKTQTLEFILTLADWPPTDNNKVLGSLWFLFTDMPNDRIHKLSKSTRTLGYLFGKTYSNFSIERTLLGCLLEILHKFMSFLHILTLNFMRSSGIARPFHDGQSCLGFLFDPNCILDWITR